MQQQKQKEDSGSSSDEFEESVAVFEFNVLYSNEGEQLISKAKHVVIATLGIQKLWVQHHFQHNKSIVVGQINFSKATQSSLATILYEQTTQSLAIVFNKELRDYHYHDYNFGDFLGTLLKDNIKNANFVILTDLPYQLLQKPIEFQNTVVFQINHLHTPLLNIPFLSEPNELQGLFADLFQSLMVSAAKVLGIVVVSKEYDFGFSQIEYLQDIQCIYQWKSLDFKKESFQEDIRQLNKNKQQGSLYL